MDFYLLVSTVTLVIQLVIFVLLIVGLGLKRQKRFRQHGLLMVSCVALHMVSVIIIMVPSFAAISFTPTGLPTIIVALSAIHTFFGLAALILGLWLSAAWRFRQSLEYCMPKKRLMLVTFAVWLIAISLGTTLYFVLYLPLMV